jgi:hypothetical protein
MTHINQFHLPYETIRAPLMRTRHEADQASPDGTLSDFLDFVVILVQQGLASRLENDQAMTGRGL